MALGRREGGKAKEDLYLYSMALFSSARGFPGQQRDFSPRQSSDLKSCGGQCHNLPFLFA